MSKKGNKPPKTKDAGKRRHRARTRPEELPKR